MSGLVFEAVSVDGLRLDGVSFAVQPGQLWAVLGPNGAGKSTLLRAALGIVPCRSGRILINGTDVAATERKTLAQHVAWVPQNPAEDTGFTALELVLMGRAPFLGSLGLPSKPDVARAAALLEEVGLYGFAERRLDEMSGGERRLCYLARARMQNARVLLFDEPTAFLDVKHQVECLRSLDALVKGGVAALAVLHDVNLAAQWATHAALLRAGKLLAQGPVREVLVAERLTELYGVPLTATEGGLFTARS